MGCFGAGEEASVLRSILTAFIDNNVIDLYSVYKN